MLFRSTLIIIQVMRSSLYTSVDENLKNLSNDPSSVADLAYRTTGQQSQPESFSGCPDFTAWGLVGPGSGLPRGDDDGRAADDERIRGS